MTKNTSTRAIVRAFQGRKHVRGERTWYQQSLELEQDNAPRAPRVAFYRDEARMLPPGRYSVSLTFYARKIPDSTGRTRDEWIAVPGTDYERIE